MKTSYKVNKAESFLLDLIKREDPSARTRLPSIARMAEAADVSFVTMWKAVQRLKNQGVLSGKRHAMSILGGEVATESRGSATLKEMSAAGGRSNSIADRIEKDLLNGVFPPGTRLGSFKELGGRYGVCYATVKKAVNRLIDRNVLCLDRKQVAVPQLTAHPSSMRITLIGIDAPHEIFTLGTVGGQFLQGIEMECARAGIGLDIVSFHLGDEEITYTDLSSGRRIDLQDSDTTAGYLYLLVAEVSSQEAVFRRLQHFKKPVAVLDIVGSDYPRLMQEDRNFRLFLSTASMEPAVQIAQLLARLGHRRIAYISPYHGGRWSQVRLEGLRRGLSSDGSVRAFTIDRVTHSDYFADSTRHGEIATLWRSLKKWQAENADAAGRHISSRLSACAEDECASSEIRALFARHFTEALADRSITAWVCANDGVAGFALDFLAENRVNVPGRVSVVGFDDSPAAMERRLTSYNFNIPSLGRAMLDYVLRKGCGPWTARNRRMEAQGVIVERKTTGPRP